MSLQKQIEKEIEEYFDDSKFSRIFVSDKDVNEVFEVEKDSMIDDLFMIVDEGFKKFKHKE